MSVCIMCIMNKTRKKDLHSDPITFSGCQFCLFDISDENPTRLLGSFTLKIATKPTNRTEPFSFSLR